MKLHDISLTIDANIPVYKNLVEKKPQIITRASHETDQHHESSILMDLHTGTHIDAPLHMIKNGATMESYPLSAFIKPCKVLDLTHVNDHISKSDLMASTIEKDDFILFKTKNSFDKEFNENFVYLNKEGAEYLFEKQITGVGTDGLGIERAQKGHETHKILLGNGIMIVEGLSLKDIEPKAYQLIILPLKIANVEASPSRAILLEE